MEKVQSKNYYYCDQFHLVPNLLKKNKFCDKEVQYILCQNFIHERKRITAYQIEYFVWKSAYSSETENFTRNTPGIPPKLLHD